MQGITNNYRPNFGSTHIPIIKDMPLTKVLDPISSYFELKGFCLETPKQVRELINSSQAGVTFHNGQLALVGKDRGADEFIAQQIGKANIPHKYVQDTPEITHEKPNIDFSV